MGLQMGITFLGSSNTGFPWFSREVVSNSCDAMDYSPPGSSVHGVSQARILECLAISFSRGLTDPGTKLRSPALQADSLPTKPPGKLLASLRASNYTFQDSS